MELGMSDIFICYSRTDRAIATKLAEWLRAEGWSFFMDVQTHVGRRWHREIEKELHAARAVVALWSAQSRDSDFVLEEAEYGKRKEILFPAFIERVEFPYGFGRIQTADLIGWAGEPEHPGLAQLLESLRLHLQGADRSQPAARPTVVVPPSSSEPVAPRPLGPGQTFRDKLKVGSEGPLMVVIPAGRFVMGSPPDEPGRSGDEGPQHEVRIAKPFALGVYAVTFDDYDRYCAATKQAKPEDRGWGRGNRPVINVSWNDAQAYCAWLCEQTGRTYRLPSEAEWEYACRAGTDTPFHFGARFTTDQANFDGNSTYFRSAKGEYRKQTVPVGTFPPNAFGLYDMHGNVWEWCQDAWHDNYDGAPTDGSAWEVGGGVARVVRGGSWNFYPAFARSAFRYHYAPDLRFGGIGFRVLCSSPIE
jgi:formylglycine-generating enzyme required for sulfatase activity